MVVAEEKAEKESAGIQNDKLRKRATSKMILRLETLLTPLAELGSLMGGKHCRARHSALSFKDSLVYKTSFWILGGPWSVP